MHPSPPKHNRSRRDQSGTARPRRPRSTGASRTPSDARLDVRPGLLDMGVAALTAVLKLDAPADLILRRFFRDHPQLGRRDRGFVADCVYAALRRLRHVTAAAGGSSPRGIFIAAAQSLPAAERRSLTGTLTPAEQAWFAQPTPEADSTLALGVRAELPDWAVDLMRASMNDAEILAIGQGMQQVAPLDLRVNTLLTTRADALEALRQAGLPAQLTRLSPLGIRIEGRPALERHPLYLEGKVEVQDEGSQLVALLVAPRRREMVVDLCAGAGGKTLALGAMMRSEGRLYAFDVSHERMRRLRTRLARSGLSNVQPEVIEDTNDVRLKRLAGKIDRVLVDAPCTGFGTLRRNPELKWRHQESAVAQFAAKQLAILAAAGRLLKPGGRLVYATCSVLAAENESVVDRFLELNPQYTALDASEILGKQGIAIACGERLRLTPHRDGTDGFFAVALERIATLADSSSRGPSEPL